MTTSKQNKDEGNLVLKKTKKKYLICAVCGKEKKPNCFNSKAKGYEDTCIQCRRMLGVEPTCKRNMENRKKKRTVKTKCLRCGKFFMSEVWGGNDRNRNRICQRCHYWETGYKTYKMD